MHLPRLLCLGLAATLLVACSDTSSSSSDDPAGQDLQVVAAFYPLHYATQRVMGAEADVVSLTSPGVDPHALELSPREVGTISSADLVIYVSGMQDAVDAAVDSQALDHALDVADAAHLVATGTGSTHHPHDDDDDDAHDHGHTDPHFWLDPERYADVTAAIADRLADLDPDNTETYQQNAAELLAELDELDQSYANGLSQCAETNLVTTHAAFGYLTDKYGLQQIPMTGSSPESEPTPARLAEIVRIVDEYQVSTIYSEILAGSAWADTVAAETGAEVRVLDPLEGVSQNAAGADYLEIMESNLQTLRDGQSCQ